MNLLAQVCHWNKPPAFSAQHELYPLVQVFTHAGRVLRAFHKVDAGNEIQISESTYSELDLLATKKLHKKNTLFVQTVDYTYNIRNWLTRINDPASLGPDAWGMELVYGPGDQTLNSNYASGQNANYNGNITMIKSRTQGQSVTPTYGFMYDGLNRLTAGYYGERGTSTYSNLDRYTEVQAYDDNGNIVSLDRYGLAGGSAGAIDDLNYTYTLNSNQISGITESVANTTFRDKGFKYYSSGNYTYDAAGNVTNEPSKGAVIAYNYLNLPRLLTLGSNTIEIEYDGGGNKLRKTVKQGSTTLYIQNYLGGIEYNSGHLEAVFHAEGRVYNTNVGTGNTTPAFRYEYAIRDHLGNTRILFTDKNNNGVLNVTAGTDNEIIQENQYYPFGMNQEGAWMNDAAARDTKYQYNSKELNDDFGLNWSDYGARWYDASIGRWNGVDLLAEKFTQHTPYNFTLNNPVVFLDPDGMAVYYDYSGNYLGDDGTDNDDVYVANKVSTGKDGKLIFHNSKSLGISHDLFLAFAATIYSESSGEKTESYIMANIVMNFIKDGKSRLKSLEELVMYNNSIYQGASQENLDSYMKDYYGKNSKNEVDAVINALAGDKYPEAREKGHFKDYSNGANAWDGVDLVDTGFKNSHRYYTWSEDSKDILIKYKKKVNGGVSVETFTYVKTNYQIAAKFIRDRTLFEYAPGGRGGEIQKPEKLVVKHPSKK
ncbi:RHS repeat domain-containing protein [Haliscomenobacter sp.]|uniref:RHS repeat domain-containing protein n=1 Tax=Haliscomenobacter sp. TaxID=2717303 RepID=UPI003594175A